MAETHGIVNIEEIDEILRNQVPETSASGVENILLAVNNRVGEVRSLTMTRDFSGVGTILAITKDGQVVVYKTPGKLPNYVALPYGDVYEQLVQRLFEKQDFLDQRREVQRVKPAEDGEARRLDGLAMEQTQTGIKYISDLLMQLVELRKPYQTRGI